MRALHTIGLVGDGDEIEALQDAAERLGITLDHEDVRHWITVGDIYDSITRAHPSLNTHHGWQDLCSALCEAVGSDPRRVTRDTILIQDTNIWKQFSDLFGRMIRKNTNGSNL